MHISMFTLLFLVQTSTTRTEKLPDMLALAIFRRGRRKQEQRPPLVRVMGWGSVACYFSGMPKYVTTTLYVYYT